MPGQDRLGGTLVVEQTPGQGGPRVFPSRSRPYTLPHLPCQQGPSSAPSDTVGPGLSLTASAPLVPVALDQADLIALVGADRGGHIPSRSSNIN